MDIKSIFERRFESIHRWASRIPSWRDKTHSYEQSLTLSVGLLWFALTQPHSAAGQHEHPVPEKLGSGKFPSPVLRQGAAEFERAAALLHSFAYSAAEKAFRDVIAKEPDCAMAHWGVAMTYFPPALGASRCAARCRRAAWQRSLRRKRSAARIGSEDSSMRLQFDLRESGFSALPGTRGCLYPRHGQTRRAQSR